MLEQGTDWPVAVTCIAFMFFCAFICWLFISNSEPKDK